MLNLLVVLLALALPALAGTTNTNTSTATIVTNAPSIWQPLAPDNVAWRVVERPNGPNRWLRDLNYEPPGANAKQVSYTLHSEWYYRTVRNHVTTNGTSGVTRSPAFRGKEFGTPINGVIQPCVTIPTTERQYEYWFEELKAP